jgi:hypothetical protein
MTKGQQMKCTTERIAFLTNRRWRVAVAVLAGCTALTACASASHHDVVRQQPPPSGMPSAEPLHPPEPVSTTYRSDTERTIAGRLHTTPDAIARQLHAQPGSTLLNLAKPLGFAQDQLGAVVLAGLDDATGTALRDAALTTDQAARETQFWHAQLASSLITETSYWFLQSNTGPTPG